MTGRIDHGAAARFGDLRSTASAAPSGLDLSYPRTTVEVDTDVLHLVDRRRITEVLHFTTNKGLTGVLATGAVSSRDRLDVDSYLAHIYTPNCRDRLKDAAWTDYVNLSISRVNQHMLGYSESWHATRDIWWSVLSFDPVLLAHPGVHFTTTNNTYSGCVQRGQGAADLEALFAPSVEWGWRGSRKHRFNGIPKSWTTDPQAEVLYPGQVPLGLLRAIYVREEDRLDDVRSLLAVFRNVAPVTVACKPEVFR